MTQHVSKMTVLMLLSGYRDIGLSIYTLKEEWDKNYILTVKEQETYNALDVYKDTMLNSLHGLLTGEPFTTEVFKEIVDKHLSENKDTLDFKSFLNRIDLYLITYRPIEFID